LTTDAVAAALAELGARPWQIEQTAQKIVDAFVEAGQSADQPDVPES
jgi:ribonuclease D